MTNEGPDINHRIIVMGVSASGKTTFGKRLAERLGAEFIDGDDLHPERNIRKMASGQPLDDGDRRPWLETVRGVLIESGSEGRSVVIACSRIQESLSGSASPGCSGPVRLVFLDLDKPLILERIRGRTDHFAKEDLVASQFAILERPDGEPNTVTLDEDKPAEEMVDDCLATWAD